MPTGEPPNWWWIQQSTEPWNKTSETNWLELHWGPLFQEPESGGEDVDEDEVIEDWENEGGFVTKDSGDRTLYPSGMTRDIQKEKPRFDLLVPESQEYEELVLTRLAELMARGIEKYGERNWEKANSEDERRHFRSSAFRHFIQWFSGKRDEDHLAAVIFNLIGSDYVERRLRKGR